MNRGAYFHFLIPANNAVVEAALFRIYVKKYWTDQFPGNGLSTDVTLRSNQKLEIFLEMPPVEIEDQDLFLEKTEKDLSTLLSQTLGYRGDLFLTLIVR